MNWDDMVDAELAPCLPSLRHKLWHNMKERKRVWHFRHYIGIVWGTHDDWGPWLHIYCGMIKIGINDPYF